MHFGAALIVDDLKWPSLDILLDGWVIEATADQTPEKWSLCVQRNDPSHLADSLDIEDSVRWVHGSLVLGRLTDQTLFRGEGYEGRSGE